MKSAIVSLLLGVAFGLKCNKKTPSYKLDRDGAIIDFNVDWPGIEWRALGECGFGFFPDKWSCQSTKFSGSFNRKQKNFWTGEEQTVKYNYESETKGCTPSAVCEKLAGGTDSCRKTTYEYEKWIPRTCNATADYDAITEDYTTTIELSCCQDANYCNADEDYSSCTEENSFSTYINGLNSCWNDFKRTFMAELLCDNNGVPNRDILSWGQNCTEEDGSWKKSLRSKVACRYKPTCAAEMRQTLTDFATCACTAATDNGYTGDFIGTAMKANWQRFCPNVEISCAPDSGIAEVLYKYWVVKTKLKIALARAAISDEIIEKIKAKIADKLNVDPITITITIGGSPATTATTRRLLEDSVDATVTFQAEDPNTRDYAESNMDDSLASELGTEIGATVTRESTTSEEGSDATEGNFNAGRRWNIVASLVMILVGIVAAN